MFYRFKPVRTRQVFDPQPGRLQEKINAIHRRWADRLNQRAGRLPASRLKALLVLAGMLACCAAAGLLYGGLSPTSLTLRRFGLDLPSVLTPISIPDGPEKQYLLNQYLDSLERAFIQDSIQNSKPTPGHDSSTVH